MMPHNVPYIYLDHNATTPVDPSALEAMMPFMKDEFGNPSSPYPIGVSAKASLEQHRKEVAGLVGCKASEIFFTSGGSESNNAVLKGMINFSRPRDHHIITSSVEHPAVLNPLLYLMEIGVEVTILPVDGYGQVDPHDVRDAIRGNTTLISIMLANNETGTLQPVKEITRIAKEYGIPVHTDAAQAVGKIPIEVDELGIDFLSIAGHKLYGPKGIGALYMREGQNLIPLIHGAGQENGKRAGTENMILSTGLGAACRVAKERLPEDMKEMANMRDRMQTILFTELDHLVLNGHPEERLPNTLNISVPGVEGSRILDGLPAIYASTGAACHDRSVKLSHVLAAMSVPPEIGMGALRLTMGRSNTMTQIEEAAKMIVDHVKKFRKTRP